MLELVLSPLERTSLSLSGRYDHNSDFKDALTFRATVARTAERLATRLHASFGTGQKAPTFIERFGFFPDQFIGNPSLEPETSTGWEAGIEQPLFDGRFSLGATYFHEDLKNEIDGFVFDPDTFATTAGNLNGTSKRRGVELTAEARVIEGLRFSGSYTYLDATQPDANAGNSSREVRRPQHVASFNSDWRFHGGKADLNLNLTYVGDRSDVFFEVAPPFGTQTVNLDGYYLASAAFSYQLAAQVRAHVRIDNLLNDSYEDVYGYNTPRRGLYAGVGLSF